MLFRSCLLLIVCVFVVTPIQAKEKLVQLPHVFYVTLPVSTPTGDINISAQYRVPRGVTESVPAVLILHSSSGVDSTGNFYAQALNEVGIATLELDMWGGRELNGGSEQRPNLPQETLPDVFAAMNYLANRKEIDNDRIAVLGFSWGGVLSLLTATNQYMAYSGTSVRFAAHVAHYPVCWVYNNVPGFEFGQLTGAPVLIQTGELDDYDYPDTCSNMVAGLTRENRGYVSLNVFNKAYHAWDRLEPTWVVEDPFSHLGQGGSVTLSPNKRIARKSRNKVVKFLLAVFEK